MTGLRHRNAGFTLIELMLVVAIIGTICAIAIPSFLRYQNRAKRSEAYANLEAMAKSQNSYFAAYGLYANSGAPQPGGGLGPAKRLWSPAADAAFATLGFRPEGNVYFDYDVNAACGCTDLLHGDRLRRRGRRRPGLGAHVRAPGRRRRRLPQRHPRLRHARRERQPGLRRGGLERRRRRLLVDCFPGTAAEGASSWPGGIGAASCAGWPSRCSPRAPRRRTRGWTPSDGWMTASSGCRARSWRAWPPSASRTSCRTTTGCRRCRWSVAATATRASTLRCSGA